MEQALRSDDQKVVIDLESQHDVLCLLCILPKIMDQSLSQLALRDDLADLKKNLDMMFLIVMGMFVFCKSFRFTVFS